MILILAWASSELKILGITTVAGNVELHNTYLNTHRLRRLAGKETSILAGCPGPMIKPLEITRDIHGTKGLGVDWPEFEVPESPQHSVDFIIEQALQQTSDPVTLCMLGSLTNLATALVKCPDMAKGIKEVVLMGGALNDRGNTSPYAEFNFFTDPHGAYRVFNSGLPIVMSPLDVTRKAIIPEGWIEELGCLDRPSSRATYEMLSAYRDGKGGGLHDPCVIAWLLSPELFTAQTCDVNIEICGERAGQSIPQWHEKGKVTAMMDLDCVGFFSLLKQRRSTL